MSESEHTPVFVVPVQLVRDICRSMECHLHAFSPTADDRRVYERLQELIREDALLERQAHE